MDFFLVERGIWSECVDSDRKYIFHKILLFVLKKGEFDLKTVESDLKYIFLSFFKIGRVWSKINKIWSKISRIGTLKICHSSFLS